MRIVVFGTGKAYRENRDRFDGEDEIVAFLDNDQKKQGGFLDHIAVHPPENISDLDYEKIIIMSDFAVEMRRQLLALGCEADTLIHYREYFSGKIKAVVPKDFVCAEGEKSCLIITFTLGYHGGAMVAVYAARELIQRGYKVTIAAPDGNALFIEEFQKTGIKFIVNRDLPYLKWNQLEWAATFEKIIVNTYPMVLCALEIGKHRPVSLWLHESDNIYPTMQYWIERIREGVFEKNIKLYAVSNNARQNFINNVTACDIEILPYGIPDTGECAKGKGEILRFAVIGSIHPIKQQLFLLQTLAAMAEEKMDKAEFITIGRAEDAEYAQRVYAMADAMERVQVAGELQRREMDMVYRQIDVVVIPSIYEALSIVATEAMMNGKICVISDNTGNAGFITSGENGFVFRNGDQEDLSEKIVWCIEHRDRLREIGENARKVYEANFTMKKMGDRLVQLP